MSITVQTPQVPITPPSHPIRPLRRLWHVPRSNVWWISLFVAILFYGMLFLYFIKMGGFGYIPGTGPLPRFGIIALFLMPIPLAYNLTATLLPCSARQSAGLVVGT
jgi:hypothetical protein